MKIDKEIYKQNENIKELDIILNSYDYKIASYEKKKELIEEKQECLKKLKFLLLIRKGCVSDENKKIK